MLKPTMVELEIGTVDGMQGLFGRSMRLLFIQLTGLGN